MTVGIHQALERMRLRTRNHIPCKARGQFVCAGVALILFKTLVIICGLQLLRYAVMVEQRRRLKSRGSTQADSCFGFAGSMDHVNTDLPRTVLKQHQTQPKLITAQICAGQNAIAQQALMRSFPQSYQKSYFVKQFPPFCQERHESLVV